MTIVETLLLSVIEGLTEFLPISSTGHLILAGRILRLPQSEFVKSFEIAIQLGAILAVICLYFGRLKNNSPLIGRVLTTFIPTGIIGLVLYKTVKQYLLGNVEVVVWSLLLGGLVMIGLERAFARHRGFKKIEDLTIPGMLILGLIQGLSIIPGVSRAAATIFGGLALGLDRKSAVEFSFLLAIPTMLAATGWDLVKTRMDYSPNDYFLMLLGFAGAFLTAIVSVKSFVRFIGHHSFLIFGVYRIALALIFLIRA